MTERAQGAVGADVLLAEILVHAACGTTTIAHGEDDGSATTPLNVFIRRLSLASRSNSTEG